MTFLGRLPTALAFASTNYRIWRIYTEPESRKKYIEVMRRYNSFFHGSIQAHFVATIITLYALFETRRKGIGLPILIRQAPDEVRARLQPILDEANGIWRKKITIFRNELYAHLSNVNFEAKFADTKLTPNDIERLIELSKQLINGLSQAATRSTYAFNLDPATDMYSLLDKLLNS